MIISEGPQMAASRITIKVLPLIETMAVPQKADQIHLSMIRIHRLHSLSIASLDTSLRKSTDLRCKSKGCMSNSQLTDKTFNSPQSSQTSNHHGSQDSTAVEQTTLTHQHQASNQTTIKLHQLPLKTERMELHPTSQICNNVLMACSHHSVSPRSRPSKNRTDTSCSK